MGWVERLLEAVKQLMQGLPGPAYQGHEHVVLVAGHRGVAKHWDMIDGSEGDIALVGLKKCFDGRPKPRGGCRLARYAASACCAASARATFHGSNSSIWLIG
jgi:hypothetical protein